MQLKQAKKTSLKKLQKEQKAAVKKLKGQIEKLLNMPCSMQKYGVHVTEDEQQHTMTATVDYQSGTQ